MKFLASSTLLVFLIRTVRLSVIPDPNADPQERLHVGFRHHHVGQDGSSWNDVYAIAGQTKSHPNSTSADPQHQRHLGYVSVGQKREWFLDQGKVEVGLYKNEDFRSSTKVLSAGVEVGLGAMGRLPVVEHEVNMGKVGINTGLSLDTGMIVKKGEVEVKFLGIGTRIGGNGIQVCLWICFGVRY